MKMQITRYCVILAIYIGCHRNSEMRWEMINMAKSCSKSCDRPVLNCKISAHNRFNLWGSFQALSNKENQSTGASSSMTVHHLTTTKMAMGFPFVKFPVDQRCQVQSIACLLPLTFGPKGINNSPSLPSESRKVLKILMNMVFLALTIHHLGWLCCKKKPICHSHIAHCPACCICALILEQSMWKDRHVYIWT